MTEFDELRWGFTFLSTNGRLSLEERTDLLMQATEMYLREEKTRDVSGETYEGRITSGTYGLIGTFSGLQFDATVENGEGKAKIRFLVNEQTKGRSASRINPYMNAN